MSAPVARPYQQDTEDQTLRCWDMGIKNVLAVLPTGAGKTFVFSHIASQHRGSVVLIAHRQELIGQISQALANWGVQHNIIAPPKVVKFVVNIHQEKFGKSFYNPGSHVTVAGVDTLLRRLDTMKSWLAMQTMWIMDEAHHIVRSNKWGKVVAAMPNAKGLGVTATPIRANGEGLGRHADGVFDEMIVGPNMRTIINEGYLTDYRVLSIPHNIDLESIPLSKSTGDYSKTQLRAQVKKSRIVGDVVEHYITHASGKLGVTFVPDIETGAEIAAKYNASGVPAECVSHKTEDSIRVSILKRFERKEVMQLVNVDLFGEGFDLPAIEVVSFARPTQSYSLFCQQFGRSLRLLDGKTEALILDHVGNVMRHGLPDMRNTWTLDRREKKGKKTKRDPDDIPVRVCIECRGTYERLLDVCPYCGFEHKPDKRGGPEQVDGELKEIDHDTFVRLVSMVNDMDKTSVDYEQLLRDKRCPEKGIAKNVRVHQERQEVQKILRAIIMMWRRLHVGKSDSEIQKRFFWLTGYDMLTAKSLGRKEAKGLAECLLMHL